MYQVQKTVEELNAIYQVGAALVLTVGTLGSGEEAGELTVSSNHHH